MKMRMTRREFIEKSIVLGTTGVLGANFIPGIWNSGTAAAAESQGVELAVASGPDYAKNTLKAIEMLGGMGRFVPPNASVAFAINTMARANGTFVKPEIVRSAVQLCKKAGAKEIAMISWLPKRAWELSGIAQVLEEEGAVLKLIDGRNESFFKTVPVPDGKILKEARVVADLFNYDVFIDMPIAKDHYGTRFTGTMKNLMGLTSPALNGFFHKGDRKSVAGDNMEQLSQCIADLNTAIKPTLCIADATEVIATNGPMGPGEMIKPQKVVAGVDRVAIDTYCAGLLGLPAKDILMISKAHSHKLGEMDLSKVKIQEASV
jgi:uncharacterized protein (DUF362 family)